MPSSSGNTPGNRDRKRATNESPRSAKRTKLVHEESPINWNEVFVSKELSNLSTDISGSDDILESKETEKTRELEKREQRIYAYLDLLRFRIVPYIRSLKSGDTKTGIKTSL